MKSKPLTIGVAGGSGSGKSTVVAALVEAVGESNVVLLPHDAYYRPYDNLSLDDRRRLNWDHPDRLETELLIKHLSELAAGRAVERPVYDFSTYSRSSQTKHLDPKPVVIVDGILVLTEAALRDSLDIKVFVDTDSDIRFIRRLLRDMEERDRELTSVVDQYLKTVRPMHLEFVEPSKRYADLIIPEGGHNRVAVEMLVARVKAEGEKDNRER